MENSKLTTKRFVIRKTLIGENKIITFTNKKDQTFTYDHDEIYTTFSLKVCHVFKSMEVILTQIQYQNSVEN